MVDTPRKQVRFVTGGFQLKIFGMRLHMPRILRAGTRYSTFNIGQSTDFCNERGIMANFGI